MKRIVITIDDFGIAIPKTVQMSDCEIAQLFGVGLATVRRELKTILRSGVVSPDCSGGAVVVGNVLLPEYYGLDIVVALAFRIHTRQAVTFRRWVLEQCRSPQIMLAFGNSKRTVVD